MWALFCCLERCDDMEEQRLREIIREELIAHDERTKAEVITIRVNDQMKATMLEVLENMDMGAAKFSL